MPTFHVKNNATGLLMSEAGKPYTYSTFECAQESAQEWQKSLDCHSFDNLPNNFEVIAACNGLRVGNLIDALVDIARDHAGFDVEWRIYSVIDKLKRGDFSD